MGGPMNDLIERIEAASGPDREIDCLIAVAASNEPTARVAYLAGYRWYKKPGAGRIPFAGAFGSGADLGMIFHERRYTDSIDAALALVPEGFEWSLEYQAGHHVSSDVECMIAIAKLGDPCRDWESESYTPALALCAAALKVRAYLKETNNAD